MPANDARRLELLRDAGFTHAEAALARLRDEVGQLPLPGGGATEAGAIRGALAERVSRLPGDQARLKPLLKQDWGEEALGLGRRVAYCWCPPGILKSNLPEAVGRLLGDAATARNWATMQKLLALARG